MPSHPPLSFAFRLLLFGLITIGVLTMPVLAIAAEIHEAQHVFDVAGGDGHVDTRDFAQPGEADSSTDSWHGLTQLCHFCGQCMALFSGPVTALGRPFLPNQPMAHAFPTDFDSLAIPVLFRPPISR
ncbi:MAG: hypothetical protein ACREQ1_06570 [Woeseiaceae bacterium]